MNKPYLKSMDIYGFKSFANQTHIDFSPKISVILGVHETGKTNILDAIRWCLFDDSNLEPWWIIIFNKKNGDSDINFVEVQLTFGLEKNDSSDTILKRRIEFGNGSSIKNECFINNEVIAEASFSENLFARGFLKQEVELGRMFYGKMNDTKYSDVLDISISRFLPTPLCLIDDSLSPTDEPLKQIITSMIKGLSETSQCIVVSQAKQIAMESDRLISVTMLGDSSKVIEIAADK